MVEARETLLDPERNRLAFNWRWVVAFFASVAVGLSRWFPDLNAQFGAGFDGFNGAVWALGADAISSDGLLDSRFGAIRPAGAYNNHPPLTVVLTWLSRGALGHSHLSTRLPALIASVAAIWLILKLLRAVGFGPRVSGIAMVIVVVTPMFLTFGVMLDTWIVGLPFGVSVLLTLAERRSSWARALSAGACALCSWQGAVLIVLALPMLWRRLGARNAVVLASLVGLLGTLAYRIWAGSGGGGLEIGWPFDARGWEYMQVGFIWSLPLLMLCPLALHDRPLGLLAVAAPAVYAIAMASHADQHPYWMYWWLVPAAMGTAIAVDRLDKISAWAGWIAMLPILLLGLSTTPREEQVDDDMAAIVEPMIAALSPTQRWIPILGTEVEQPWLEYESGRPLRYVDSLSEIPTTYRFVSFVPVTDVDSVRCRSLSTAWFLICARWS